MIEERKGFESKIDIGLILAITRVVIPIVIEVGKVVVPLIIDLIKKSKNPETGKYNIV